MVKIQPLEAPEAPTRFDFLEYLDDIYGLSQNSIFEEFFSGDWRKGQEISKIVITKRFYQISSSLTQA